MRSSNGCILRSISLSRWSMVRIALTMNMWCSVNFPSTAKAISSFVDLSFQCVQSSNNFSGLVSPAITASITAVHVLPRILENTLLNFMLQQRNQIFHSPSSDFIMKTHSYNERCKRLYVLLQLWYLDLELNMYSRIMLWYDRIMLSKQSYHTMILFIRIRIWKEGENF